MNRIHCFLIAGACLLSVMLCYSIYKVFLYCVTPQRCTVQIDSCAAPYFSEHFEDKFAHGFYDKPVVTWFVAITEDMESCTNITCGFSPHHAHVRITSAPPVARINGTLILTLHGKLVPAHEYLEEALVGLPKITVSDVTVLEQKHTHELMQFIQQASPELLHNYHVHWKDKTAIYLQHLLPPTYTIITTYKAQLKPELFASVQRIAHQPRIVKNIKKGTAWIVDVRFQGQIIRTPMPQNVQGGL